MANQQMTGMAGRRGQAAGPRSGANGMRPGGAGGAGGAGAPGAGAPQQQGGVPLVPHPAPPYVPNLGFSANAPGGGPGAFGPKPGVPGAVPGAMPMGPSAQQRTSLGANVSYFQQGTEQGTRAIGQMLAQDFGNEAAEVVGGLNSIGALRSGGYAAPMNDLMTKYGREVGNVASAATLQSQGLGMENYQYEREAKFREDEARRARKASKFGAIGRLVGGAVGLLPGGQGIGKVLAGMGG